MTEPSLAVAFFGVWRDAEQWQLPAAVSNDVTVSPPGQSMQSADHLGPSLSLDRGAPLFELKIPEKIRVDGVC